MLQQALAMSLEAGGVAPAPPKASTTPAAAPATPTPAPAAIPDFSAMTEEEQIAYAMQISMQDCSK